MANVRALSFIEIIIVIALIAILGSSLGFISTTLVQRQTTLDTVAQDIISTLRNARTRAIGSENLSAYGVHFESDKYVLFQGTTYTVGAPSNEVYQIPQELELSSIPFIDVIFQRIDGSTGQPGTFTLRVKADPSKKRDIVIESSGNVSIDEGISPTNTRVSDTRHVHVQAPGWSILGATTLTLTFGNPLAPEHIETITMAPYFDAGPTKFDWQGTINVGGQNQALRIHTHALTPVTTLCVHRDIRFNTKQLFVEIDGVDVVSYDTTNQASVLLLGGTLTTQ